MPVNVNLGGVPKKRQAPQPLETLPPLLPSGDPGENDTSGSARRRAPPEMPPRRSTVNDAQASSAPAGGEAHCPVERYRVGKGKPPLETRFSKGWKGGPGRPKGAKNRATLLAEALDTPVSITVHGKRRRMTARELGYQQLSRKVAKGEIKAIVVAEALTDKLIGPETSEQSHEAPLSETELAILRRLGDG